MGGLRHAVMAAGQGMPPLPGHDAAEIRMALFDALPVTARETLDQADMPIGDGMIAELRWALAQNQPSRLDSAIRGLAASLPDIEAWFTGIRGDRLDAALVMEFRQNWWAAQS